MKPDSTDLIARRLIFGNPEYLMPRVSPDGRRLGWLAPSEGVLNVWVAPVGDPARARVVTSDRGRGIPFFQWAEAPDLLFYVQDRDGDENFHLYRVDLESGEILDLTPLDGVRARLWGVSPLHPEEILVGLNDRDSAQHDLYRVHLRSGERVLLRRNDEGFATFLCDAQYRVRLAQRITKEGGLEYLREDGAGGWQPFLSVPQEDSLTTHTWGFDRAGDSLFLMTSQGRDTAALYEVESSSGARRLLAENDQCDAGAVLLDPRTDRPLAVRFRRLRSRWECIDPAVHADLEALAGRQEGEIEVVSQTRDGEIWVVEITPDDAPVRYGLWFRRRREFQPLFTSRPGLEGRVLARDHATIIPARDGLELVSYLTLPPGSEGERSGRPAAPLPTVLVVHGGPWSRDVWGFSPICQWLANRGYAVLRVNFRGSTGFGKRFVNAGDREWGRRMHDDLLDAVDWAVREGIADRSRIGIFGGSYGGYAALAGMSFTPGVFACGVSLVGPSNLITLLESIPPYWGPIRAEFMARVGNLDTQEGRTLLVSRSPVHRAGDIRGPLLIGQGANDPRVKRAESDQIVEAMQARDIPVSYLLYGDEGHGFARPENRLSFYAAAEAFLARTLGGRVEAVGDDLAGSSVQVVAGGEFLR